MAIGAAGSILGSLGNVVGRGMESVGSGLGRAGEGLAGRAPTTSYRPSVRKMEDRTYDKVMDEFSEAKERPVEKVQGQAQDLQGQQLAAMQQQIAGQAPSQTDIAAQRASQQAVAQQRAMAAGTRGSANPALAQRQAAQNVATAQQDIAGQAMQGRIAEQRQFLDALATGRGQDIQTAQANAQIQSWADEYKKQLLAMGMDADKANLQAAVEADRLSAQLEGQILAGRQQAFQTGVQVVPGMIGGAAKSVAGALGGIG